MSGFVLDEEPDSLDAQSQQPISFDHDLQSARQAHPSKQSSLPNGPEVPPDPSQSSNFTERPIDETRCFLEIQPPPSPLAGQHPSTQQGDAPSWLDAIASEMQNKIADLREQIQTLKRENLQLKDCLGENFTG